MALERIRDIDNGLLNKIAGCNLAETIRKRNTAANDLKFIKDGMKRLGASEEELEVLAQSPEFVSNCAKGLEQAELLGLSKSLVNDLGSYDQKTITYLAENYTPEGMAIRDQELSLKGDDFYRTSLNLLAAKLEDDDDERMLILKKAFNAGLVGAAPEILRDAAKLKLSRSKEAWLESALYKPELDKKGKQTGKIIYDSSKALSYVGKVMADDKIRAYATRDLVTKFRGYEAEQEQLALAA